MNGIIKRRKTSDYAQIHNGALQQLEDIRSIGLIAHLMSLPDTWVISKMQLYSKFGRGPITNAIKELEAKKYWVTIQYRDGKKTLYYYNVSDVAFDDSHVLNMIEEINQRKFKITAITESFTHLLGVSIAENQQPKSKEKEECTSCKDSCVADFEQCKINCSNSNVENTQLLKEIELITNKEKQNKDKRNIVNLQGIDKFLNANKFKIALISACNEFYTEFAPSRWSKQSWLTLIETFVNEKIEDCTYDRVPANKIRGYAYASIKNMAHKVDMKNGNIEFSSSGELPYYDWLNN
ncbi:hypothetical protein QFZ31_006381 [Neobacillus niacini]|uniref:hypothetical protein n=1 Tax=Neobacillus driksii TaxID=3035913 RepID=UPI0027889FB1|nr:hypothetical protein [Neobacillus niacini]MDQ0976503.1 hypothetical protein [Neobacillus niacini]